MFTESAIGTLKLEKEEARKVIALLDCIRVSLSLVDPELISDNSLRKALQILKQFDPDKELSHNDYKELYNALEEIEKNFIILQQHVKDISSLYRAIQSIFIIQERLDDRNYLSLPNILLIAQREADAKEHVGGYNPLFVRQKEAKDKTVGTILLQGKPLRKFLSAFTGYTEESFKEEFDYRMTHGSSEGDNYSGDLVFPYDLKPSRYRDLLSTNGYMESHLRALDYPMAESQLDRILFDKSKKEPEQVEFRSVAENGYGFGQDPILALTQYYTNVEDALEQSEVLRAQKAYMEVFLSSLEVPQVERWQKMLRFVSPIVWQACQDKITPHKDVVEKAIGLEKKRSDARCQEVLEQFKSEIEKYKQKKGFKSGQTYSDYSFFGFHNRNGSRSDIIRQIEQLINSVDCEPKDKIKFLANLIRDKQYLIGETRLNEICQRFVRVSPLNLTEINLAKVPEILSPMTSKEKVSLNVIEDYELGKVLKDEFERDVNALTVEKIESLATSASFESFHELMMYMAEKQPPIFSDKDKLFACIRGYNHYLENAHSDSRREYILACTRKFFIHEQEAKQQFHQQMLVVNVTALATLTAAVSELATTAVNLVSFTTQVLTEAWLNQFSSRVTSQEQPLLKTCAEMANSQWQTPGPAAVNVVRLP